MLCFLKNSLVAWTRDPEKRHIKTHERRTVIMYIIYIYVLCLMNMCLIYVRVYICIFVYIHIVSMNARKHGAAEAHPLESIQLSSRILRATTVRFHDVISNFAWYSSSCPSTLTRHYCHMSLIGTCHAVKRSHTILNILSSKNGRELYSGEPIFRCLGYGLLLSPKYELQDCTRRGTIGEDLPHKMH